MVGPADRVLVVLDHEQRIALRLELRQRVEQDAIVARVQADGGFVEDVAHAAQIGAELCGESDALRLAARKRRRSAIEREIAETDVVEKGKPRSELREDVASDLGLAPAKLQLRDESRGLTDRQPRQLGDRPAAHAHRERLGLEACTLACRTRGSPRRPMLLQVFFTGLRRRHRASTPVP